jgi:hypothetical protein
MPTVQAAAETPEPAAEPRKKASPYVINEANSKSVNELIQKDYEVAKENRWKLEREWLFMLLFASGNQNVVWDRGQRRYRAKSVPKYINYKITNKLRSHIDANVSAVTRHPPQVNWFPLSLDPGDVASADMANRVNAALEMEARRREDSFTAARWNVTCGDVFIESYWDSNPKYGEAFIQDERCQDCLGVFSSEEVLKSKGTCPECGSENLKPAVDIECAECPATGATFLPGEDERMEDLIGQPSPMVGSLDPVTGDPIPDPNPPPLIPRFGKQKIGRNVPRGRIGERVRSPFEVFYDPNIRSFSKQGGCKWVLILELVDRQGQVDLYGEDAVPAHEDVSGDNQSLSYLDTLSTLTDAYFSAGTSSIGSGSGSRTKGERVARLTYYRLPNKRFPEGLHAVTLGGPADGKVVELGPLASHDTDGDCFISVVQIPFDVQPGRIAGRTAMLDVAKLQDQRNSAETIMWVSAQRMAVPHWLWPQGSLIEEPSGEPGSKIIYRLIDAGGTGRMAKPEIVQPQNPAQFWQWYIEHLDTKMEELSGSFGVAHGEAPPGITAASALALLSEKQQNKVAPQVRQWELGWEEVARQQMFLFREYGFDEHTFVLAGTDRQWEMEKFSMADLSGRFNCRVESGSALPRSTAQMRATIEGELNLGLLDITNPGVRRKIHTHMGTQELEDAIDIDLRDAERENDRYMRLEKQEDGGREPEIRPQIDNHAAHLEEHIKVAKTDEFIAMEQRAKAGDVMAQYLVMVWYMHIEQHMAVIEAQMAAQQQAQGDGEEEPEPGTEGEGNKGEGQPPRTSDGKRTDGPGRPEGSGKKVFGKRKDGRESETRAITEPRAAITA